MVIERFFAWYLMEVPAKLLDMERILIVWIWRFFSIGFFLPRIFSPWRMDITSYGRGFDLKIWLHAFLWNLVSRIIGAFLRLFLICLGLVLELLALGESIVAVGAWYAWPIIVGYLLISGIKAI